MSATNARRLAGIGLAACSLATARGEALPGLDPRAAGDLRRGLAASGAKTSDAPALRLETAPSPAYRLGAALGAWRNATQTLDYDLKTPSGDGDDAETILGDCYDERVAFADLEAARAALGVAPEEALVAARLSEDGVKTRSIDRRREPPRGCRPAQSPSPGS
jgi:hypothetical protein